MGKLFGFVQLAHNNEHTLKGLISFALRNKSKWHKFNNDRETVSLICAGHNLGIIQITKNNSFKLANEEKAKRYLNQFKDYNFKF